MSNKRRRKTSGNKVSTKPRPRPKPAAAAPAKRSIDWRKVALYGLGVVAIGLLVLFIVNDQPTRLALPDDPRVPERVQTFGDLDRSHTDLPVSYEQSPPVGGPHNPTWLNCGFYDEPVPDVNVVHSLEHGVVWVTYQDGLPDAELDTLRALAVEPEVIVSPYPDLQAPIVASVWGAQATFDSAEDPELLDFVVSLRNATAPEAGAGCLGGVGQPDR